MRFFCVFLQVNLRVSNCRLYKMHLVNIAIFSSLSINSTISSSSSSSRAAPSPLSCPPNSCPPNRPAASSRPSTPTRHLSLTRHMSQHAPRRARPNLPPLPLHPLPHHPRGHPTIQRTASVLISNSDRSGSHEFCFPRRKSTSSSDGSSNRDTSLLQSASRWQHC